MISSNIVVRRVIQASIFVLKESWRSENMWDVGLKNRLTLLFLFLRFGRGVALYDMSVTSNASNCMVRFSGGGSRGFGMRVLDSQATSEFSLLWCHTRITSTVGGRGGGQSQVPE